MGALRREGERVSESLSLLLAWTVSFASDARERACTRAGVPPVER